MWYCFTDISLLTDEYAGMIYTSLREGVRGRIDVTSCSKPKIPDFYTRCLIASGHYWMTSNDLAVMLKWHERWEILSDVRDLSELLTNI